MPITILLPAHGKCEYISKCFQSIHEQDYVGDVQVIVVDDGLSSDARSSIYSFQDSVSVTIVSNRGNGLVDALNTGLYEVNTDLVARLDSDDMMMPSRLSRQVERMNQNLNLAVLGTQLQYINSDGTVIGKSNYPFHSSNVQKLLPKNCVLAHPSVIMRTDYILRVGGYRKYYQFAEDYDLWLRLIDKYEIDNLNEFLTIYRLHQSQISVVRQKEQVMASLAAQQSYLMRKTKNRDLSDFFVSTHSWWDNQGVNSKRKLGFYELKFKHSSTLKGHLPRIRKFLLLLFMYPIQTLKYIFVEKSPISRRFLK